MKKLIGLLVLMLSFSSYASLGRESGGGHPQKLLFSAFADMTHKAMVLAKPKDVNFEIDTNLYKKKLDSVLVILVNDEALEKDEKLKKTIEELKAAFGGENMAYFHAKEQKIYLIQDVFERETQKNLGATLGTITHEYFRAMKMQEDTYKYVSKLYNTGFFEKVANSLKENGIGVKEIKEEAEIEYFVNKDFSKINMKHLEFLDNRLAMLKEARETERIKGREYAKEADRLMMATLPSPEALRNMGNVLYNQYKNMSLIPSPFTTRKLAEFGKAAFHTQAAMVGLVKARSEAQYVHSIYEQYKRELKHLDTRIMKYTNAIDKIILGE